MRQWPAEERRVALLKLSHELGREDRSLAILGEGNTSTRLAEDIFLVKASGCNLGTLKEDDLVECRMSMILPLVDRSNLSDVDIESALLASRLDPRSKRPSVEALFHAYLLTLPGIEFVAHAHPVSVNQILCSRYARRFAENRLFPDEIVSCGVASVFVPYTDPGLRLAQAVRAETESFVRNHDLPPRVILIENHGIITLGDSPQAPLAAMLMAEKAAKIWIGAAVVGGPNFLNQENVRRIAQRPDERYRQRKLDSVDA
jgi:rhamnose utilization protein RhaD (predicted bifunctional aldolase and dehydrogenase)